MHLFVTKPYNFKQKVLSGFQLKVKRIAILWHFYSLTACSFELKRQNNVCTWKPLEYCNIMHSILFDTGNINLKFLIKKYQYNYTKTINKKKEKSKIHLCIYKSV